VKRGESISGLPNPSAIRKKEPMQKLTTLGFDADDTLWHSEDLFRLTHAKFMELLSDYAAPDQLSEWLLAAETRNLGTYGFGIKGFVLSMIETALDVTDNAVPSTVIAEILATGKDMLAHPIELLPGVRGVVEALAAEHTLVLITKGDLLDQERKLAQSGLGELFDAVEVVSDKTRSTYETAFARHGDGAAQAMMIGNSLKSDVIPALEAGAWAVHIPYKVTWSYEQADAPVNAPRYLAASNFQSLPDLINTVTPFE